MCIASTRAGFLCWLEVDDHVMGGLGLAHLLRMELARGH